MVSGFVFPLFSAPLVFWMWFLSHVGTNLGIMSYDDDDDTFSGFFFFGSIN